MPLLSRALPLPPPPIVRRPKVKLGHRDYVSVVRAIWSSASASRFGTELAELLGLAVSERRPKCLSGSYQSVGLFYKFPINQSGSYTSLVFWGALHFLE